MQTDVLVVGAGPTGLMLATELGLAGVVPVVVDALPAPSGQAKGGGVQPRTAEVFDLRGMTRISQFAAMVRDGDGYWSMLSPLEGDLYRLVFGPLEATATDRRRDRPVGIDEIRHALQAVWGPDTELGDFTWASRFSDATR